MKLKQCLFFIAIITTVVFSKTIAADLHAFYVCDTHDTTIGNAAAIDYKKMRTEAQSIANYTNLTLHEEKFYGFEFKAKKIIDSINHLTVSPNDVIIFYYTGHGYRDVRKSYSNPLPNLAFSYDPAGIDLNDITELLREKGARFVLIMADCCNNVIPYVPPLYLAKPKAATTIHVKDNYCKLFLDYHGVIVMASCKPEQFSYCDDFRGGFFTRHFLRIIHKESLENNMLSWENLFDLIYYHVWNETKNHPDGRQEPIYIHLY